MMSIDERYDKVLAWFQENVPNPRTELEYDSPFHLLLAVILSAQCSDKRVNMITPPLFAAFPTPVSLATAPEARVLEYVKSISYPNSKTRHLIGVAKMLNEEFDGEVPSDIDSLLRLPGVGRKTANVILSVVWNQAAMAVDTHVFRVSHRLGFTRNCKTPFETEQELCRHIPEHLIAKAHHWFILHGRYVCMARQPHCDKCGLTQYCMAYADSKEHKNAEVNLGVADEDLAEYFAANASKLHGTPLSLQRVAVTLGINYHDDVLAVVRSLILRDDARFTQRGTNCYIESNGYVITINVRSLRVVTAHHL